MAACLIVPEMVRGVLKFLQFSVPHLRIGPAAKPDRPGNNRMGIHVESDARFLITNSQLALILSSASPSHGSELDDHSRHKEPVLRNQIEGIQ